MQWRSGAFCSLQKYIHFMLALTVRCLVYSLCLFFRQMRMSQNEKKKQNFKNLDLVNKSQLLM